MAAAPVSDDFRNLQAAQQKVLRCLEIAGETLEELAKVEQADEQAIRASCEEFLQTIQEVQRVLIPAVEKYASREPFQGGSGLARARAEAAAGHADVLQAKLEALRQGARHMEVEPPAAEQQPANGSGVELL